MCTRMTTSACLSIVLQLLVLTPASAQAGLAIEWNELVLSLAEKEDGFLTLKGVRAAAMMHTAMHDALNNVELRYQPFVYSTTESNADAQSAAVQSAYAVLKNQYPDQLDELDKLRGKWFSGVADTPEVRRGIELGNVVARAIFENRTDDGWDADIDYQWHPMGPGVYAEFDEHSGTPNGFVFGTGWGTARPFGVENLAAFRIWSPPEIGSTEYAAAFNEVKEVGRFQSMSRTPDQTHLALWWKPFAEMSHNRLARELAATERLNLVDATRLFALLNIAIFDAYVSSFENKFHFNHWRPYTAIRWAANDGNPHTEAEESWTNTHRHTYAFPSFPSAHGTACGAAMTVLADVFGNEYSFIMTNRFVDLAGPFSAKIEMSPPTRSFASFGDAAEECGLSRLYLGIHFRYDSVAGVELGNRIGSSIIERHMRKVED